VLEKLLDTLSLVEEVELDIDLEALDEWWRDCLIPKAAGQRGKKSHRAIDVMYDHTELKELVKKLFGMSTVKKVNLGARDVSHYDDATIHRHMADLKILQDKMVVQRPRSSAVVVEITTS
jgi:hypothetical protein